MTPWAYWRPPRLPTDAGSIVEFSSVCGWNVGLPTHFHDEDQVTFVIAGRRRFRIGGELVELHPGQGYLIAAGTPHSSFEEPAGARCFNAYVEPSRGYASELMDELARRWRVEQAGTPACVAFAAQPRRFAPDIADMDGTVAQAAARAGLSREGFSRSFHRSHGISPRAFQLTAKLNRARELLRAGLPIAAAAADTGFADQSHLGRCFRRAFGVTPGAYRAGLSQSFQTDPRD